MGTVPTHSVFLNHVVVNLLNQVFSIWALLSALLFLNYNEHHAFLTAYISDFIEMIIKLNIGTIKTWMKMLLKEILMKNRLVFSIRKYRLLRKQGNISKTYWKNSWQTCPSKEVKPEKIRIKSNGHKMNKAFNEN